MYNYYILVVLLLSQLNNLHLGSGQCTPDEGKETTQFRVAISYSWNKESDAAFPTKPDQTAGFKPMSCVTHNQNFTLWEPGKLSTGGFRKFFTDAAVFEVSQTDPFLSIINMYANVSTNVENVEELIVEDSDLRPGIGDISPRVDQLKFSETREPEDSFNISILASAETPLLSCFALIFPSADWFIGVTNVNLCDYPKFVMKDGTLRAFDAGIYDTSNYESAEEAGQEPEPNPFIRQVRIVAPRGFGAITILKETAEDDINSTATNRSCFPANEPVTLATGESIPIHQLPINELVLSPSFSSSSSPYPSSLRSISTNHSRIIAFSHHDKYVISRFIQVTYQFKDNSVKHIRLSPGHYIYRFSPGSKLPLQLVTASEINLHDTLVNGLNNDDFNHPTVIQLNTVLGRGLYNPHSTSGNLVVGGILVSCYTSAVTPTVATAALAPIRLISRLGLGSFADPMTRLFSAVGRGLMTWIKP